MRSCIFLFAFFIFVSSLLEAEIPSSEVLVYDILYKGLKVGEATLEFKGQVEYRKEKAYLVIFKVDTLYFKDTEKIFASSQFLPLVVERHLKPLIGVSEYIREEYDQKKFKVNITKKNPFFGKKICIHKKNFIHNAILLSYHLRLLENLEKMRSKKITLPTQEFTLINEGIKLVDIGSEKKEVVVIKSKSPKFILWFSNDDRKIPLRIEESSLGGYCFILKEMEVN